MRVDEIVSLSLIAIPAGRRRPKATYQTCENGVECAECRTVEVLTKLPEGDGENPPGVKR